MEILISLLGIGSLLLGIWVGRKFFQKHEVKVWLVYTPQGNSIDVYGMYGSYEQARERMDSILEQVPSEKVTLYVETVNF